MKKPYATYHRMESFEALMRKQASRSHKHLVDAGFKLVERKHLKGPDRALLLLYEPQTTLTALSPPELVFVLLRPRPLRIYSADMHESSVLNYY